LAASARSQGELDAARQRLLTLADEDERQVAEARRIALEEAEARRAAREAAHRESEEHWRKVYSGRSMPAPASAAYDWAPGWKTTVGMGLAGSVGRA